MAAFPIARNLDTNFVYNRRMQFTIRAVETHEEYFAVEQLQMDAWNMPEREVVPLNALITAQRNGGLVLGAFDSDRLIGFVYGFPGLTPEGQLKHCSHMLAVHPAFRDQHIGHALKLAQRKHVQQQGIPLITWTYDPLEGRNAFLNIHRLGGISKTYIRNIYGESRSGINAGLPTDRFLVEWWIDSPHVAERLASSDAGQSLAGQIALDPLSTDERALPADRTFLLRFPANLQALKQSDPALARRWRFGLRTLCEAAFAQGYQIADVLRDNDERFYVLVDTASLTKHREA
jgi:predicted GNAT superfamily acetyltransferase